MAAGGDGDEVDGGMMVRTDRPSHLKWRFAGQAGRAKQVLGGRKRTVSPGREGHPCWREVTVTGRHSAWTKEKPFAAR
jgi:hypothetical protein